jgi:hypothetical protein
MIPFRARLRSEACSVRSVPEDLQTVGVFGRWYARLVFRPRLYRPGVHNGCWYHAAEVPVIINSSSRQHSKDP